MKRNMLRTVALVCLAVPIAMSACKRAETPPPPPPPAAAPAPAPAQAPFRVSSVTVGNAIDADKRVVSPTSTLAPSDTIYASVATVGVAPSVTLTARWTYGDDGQLVNEESQTIAPTGPAVSEFHIAKPDGWPTGKYSVVIIANGDPAASQEFEVQ